MWPTYVYGAVLNNAGDAGDAEPPAWRAVYMSTLVCLGIF